MDSTKPELTVITLTRDNISELELTLRSVTLQTRRPSRLIVVDGSSRENAKFARTLAAKAGAEYVWRQPNGIYDAMNFSESMLQGDGFVMWLNSSDWLAGSRVIEHILGELSSLRPETDWIIGQLLRRSSTGIALHKGLWKIERLESLMKVGWTGFPHPSTVFRIRALREVGGFAEGSQFDVARDYDLALRLLTRRKLRLIRAIFSVHVPMGFSSRMQVRGFIEKFVSRLTRLSWPMKLVSLIGFPILSFVAVYRQLEGESKWKPVPTEAILGHYCPVTQTNNWPYCCDEALDLRTTYPSL